MKANLLLWEVLLGVTLTPSSSPSNDSLIGKHWDEELGVCKELRARVHHRTVAMRACSFTFRSLWWHLFVGVRV